MTLTFQVRTPKPKKRASELTLVNLNLFKSFNYSIFMKDSFDELVKIMQKLRKECPWDKEQTIESFKKDILGEIKELSDAVDKKDYENLKEEIGDVMISLIALSVVVKEKGYFDINDSIKEAIEKMIRRHPHVFGNKKAKNANEALKLFYKAKEQEKRKK